MATFYINGGSPSSNRGWVGFTGSTNYVVSYAVPTGASGAQSVSIALQDIWSRQGGGASWGFKISKHETEFANASGAPHSNTAYLEYSSSIGYNCVLTAENANLEPNSTYYIFVYCVRGAEYYAGTWNLTNPTITLNGSYRYPDIIVSSITDTVNTLDNVTIQIENPHNIPHTCAFKYAGNTLDVSPAFTTTLTFKCPRSWFLENISVDNMSITAEISNAQGGLATRSFLLIADSGMVPVFEKNAVSIVPLNEGGAAGMEDYISNVSKVQGTFDTDKIDLEATAGAEIRSYAIIYNGEAVSSPSLTTLNTRTITGSGSVTLMVTDSRGRTASQILPFTALPYVVPSLSSYTAERCNQDGTASESGLYYKVTAVSVFTSLSGANTARITVAIKQGSGSYGSETEITSGVQSILGGALQADLLYIVRFTVTDTIGNTRIYTVKLAYQSWAMKFRADGKGVAFGMGADHPNAVEIPSTWSFLAGNVEINNDKIVLTEYEGAGTMGIYGESLPPSGVEGQLFFLLQA